MTRAKTPRSAPDKKAYTMQEFAQAYGISTEYIRLLTRKGDITPSYVGRKPLYPVEEVERWFATLDQEPARSV